MLAGKHPSAAYSAMPNPAFSGSFMTCAAMADVPAASDYVGFIRPSSESRKNYRRRYKRKSN
jgi:hypothetical protein